MNLLYNIVWLTCPPVYSHNHTLLHGSEARGPVEFVISNCLGNSMMVEWLDKLILGGHGENINSDPPKHATCTQGSCIGVGVLCEEVGHIKPIH
jgi:hypothetical protein